MELSPSCQWSLAGPKTTETTFRARWRKGLRWNKYFQFLFFLSKYFHERKTSVWQTYKWFHAGFFQMDGGILLKSLKPDTVDWGSRPPFVSCFTNPAVPHRRSLFQGCHWIASKPFPEAPRSLDKRCFHSTTSGRRGRREPFEITVPMKREKLRALRSDSVCTRERRDHPYACDSSRDSKAHSSHTHTHTLKSRWNQI